MSKKITELDETKLSKVSGGENEPSSSDWTICPRCGGTLEPYDMAMTEWEQFRCTSCHLIFNAPHEDPSNPNGPGKIYL